MYSHDLVAAVEKHDKSFYADGIARVFTGEKEKSGKPLDYIRMDIWPLTWNHEAYAVKREKWRKGGELPVLEQGSPIDRIGNLSVVCESFTPEGRDTVYLGREVGELFQCFTQYGQTMLARFYSFPANPHYYSNKGTIRIYFDKNQQQKVA